MESPSLKESWGDSNYYFKTPDITSYASNNVFAKSFLNVTKINERLIKYPQLNLAAYLGYIINQGLIVRLAFRKYRKTLSGRIQNVEGLADFIAQEHKGYIDNIKAIAANWEL